MSNYFTSPEDLRAWVKSKQSPDIAIGELVGIIGKDKKDDQQDIVDTCRSIFEDSDENASSVLFGVLAKHNLADLEKISDDCDECKIIHEAASRQRNNWERGMRNKFNRTIHGFNEGTPWRIDRDKFYNFTHYYIDAIQFDEDPEAVYSGEAIWRNYIMDKFYREYKDEYGKWVGGYINDRFHVFPDAGTPANPNVPRDGGNQMQLAHGEKSRKPRPHQWSTERRLEEARGTKGKDLEAHAESKGMKVLASISRKSEEMEDSKIYNMIRDTIEMREAGFEYEDMIQKIAEHYDSSITNVAQIDLQAQKLIQKHAGIMYGIEKRAQVVERTTFVANEDIEVMPAVDMAQPKILPAGANFVSTGPNTFQALDVPSLNYFSFMGKIPMEKITNLDAQSNDPEYSIQDASDEVGLNEDPGEADFPVEEIN